MRVVWILLAALLLGGTGGYAWSVLTAPPAAQPHIPKPKIIAIAPSPEEMPEEADKQWEAEADDSVRTVDHAGCKGVRAADDSTLVAGPPGDRDDGSACETVHS